MPTIRCATVTRVVILTSDELRHRFVRMAVALHGALEVLCTYCEAPADGLASTLARRSDVEEIERSHLRARSLAERDFFGAFCALAPDRSRPLQVSRGAINDDEVVGRIIELAPDVVATFGCSIVTDPLIAAFPDRIVNLHLGLSPYYRGSGTNLWPLVNGEPELVGATFMHLDAGIDTGEIIHQMRARIAPGDDAHRIGNRLISDAAVVFGHLLARHDRLVPVAQPTAQRSPRYYRRADLDATALGRLHANLSSGMVDAYLDHQMDRDLSTPIVSQARLIGPDG